MRSIATLILSALVWTAHATDSPFVGTWSGYISERAENELTIRHVTTDGTTSGWYCVRKAGQILAYDFHTNGTRHGAVEAKINGETLMTQIGDFRIRASVNRTGDAIAFEAKSDKRTDKHTLHASPNAESPCRPRIIPIVVEGIANDDKPTGQTFAKLIAEQEPNRHPLIGSWSGQRKSGLLIELTVTDVSSGRARGMYCNVWSTGWRALDMDPDIRGGIDASATDTTLQFNLKGREFTFVADSPDTMTYVQKRATGTQTLKMERTTEPSCAARIIVPTT